ncbi:MAG: hypothetical protein QM610_14080 [Chitinophagaceae bacterium]
MNPNIRVPFLWLTISVCYIMHGSYNLSALFFGVDIKLPDAKGVVPAGTHVFRILVEILVLVVFLISLYAKSKTFYVFSYVLAILFALLNIVHLAETITTEIQDYSQLALLSFVVVANILLVMDSQRSWKSLKQKNSSQ